MFTWCNFIIQQFCVTLSNIRSSSRISIKIGSLLCFLLKGLNLPSPICLSCHCFPCGGMLGFPYLVFDSESEITWLSNKFVSKYTNIEEMDTPGTIHSIYLPSYLPFSLNHLHPPSHNFFIGFFILVNFYLTNREALTVLCSVVKHAGSG